MSLYMDTLLAGQRTDGPTGARIDGTMSFGAINGGQFGFSGDFAEIRTYDGALSAQFEHTVTVTNDGVEILTLPEDRPLDLTVAD